MAHLFHVMQTNENQDSDDGEAQAWEKGCANDTIRNDFIIPHLAELVESERPSRILDLGTGTAYILRKVDEKLSYRPEWFALDHSDERLKLAQALKRPDMNLRLILSSIDTDMCKFAPIDLVSIIFTLLELPDPFFVISSISVMLRPGSILVIVVPDVWRDAFQMNGQTSGSANALLEGGIDLAKIDKFTGQPYPFHARRIEHLIASVLDRSFALEALKQGGKSGEVFLMVFRKLADSPFRDDRNAR